MNEFRHRGEIANCRLIHVTSCICFNLSVKEISYDFTEGNVIVLPWGRCSFASHNGYSTMEEVFVTLTS